MIHIIGRDKLPSEWKPPIVSERELLQFALSLGFSMESDDPLFHKKLEVWKQKYAAMLRASK